MLDRYASSDRRPDAVNLEDRLGARDADELRRRRAVRHAVPMLHEQKHICLVRHGVSVRVVKPGMRIGQYLRRNAKRALQEAHE